MATATPKQVRLIQQARSESSAGVTEAVLRRIHMIRLETIDGFSEAAQQAVREIEGDRLVERMIVGVLGGMKTGSIHVVH
jgi:hypothetical protein